MRCFGNWSDKVPLSLDVEMKDTGAWWIYENQQKLMIRDWNEDKRFQGFRERAEFARN